AGILILEGDAGTGKNVLVDIFSHFTNRETMTFSCNFQTEKEDLTYAFHFDPKKGTYAVDSRLIEMLQTPGSVIVLDEINTLPPGVTKMLNPLLDYRRTLYLPDGREVKAHDSVVIVGTMNPQHYLGVKALSQEVISRSRVMNVDYPAEKRADGTWAPYEAEMLAKAFPRLQNFTHEEFERAWDFAINQKLDNEGDKLLDEATQADLKRLHRIVRSANRVREAYRAFHGGTSTDPLEFVFSIREGTQIASELRYQEDALRAIQDVVLPKIADPQEKKRVKTILENI
ncbi:MAG: AAA family ATPase, partial [Bdellovibrionales bacterium]|nr:AAA family ATPase [Bdellovibrionales bacterium]